MAHTTHNAVEAMEHPTNEPSPEVNDNGHLGAQPNERQPLLGNRQERNGLPVALTGSQFRGILLLLLLGELLASIDNTILFATLAPIASKFDNLSHAGWIASAYTVGLLSVQPLCGRLSDVFGRKALLLFGYMVLTVGCMVCGSSIVFTQLIAGRALSGVGGAIVRVLASILITDLVAKKDVALYRSYINVAATAGRSLGGPVGGWIYDVFGWKTLFYFRVPMLLLSAALVLAQLAVPEVGSSTLPTSPPVKQQSLWDKAKKLDFVGVFLTISWVIAIVTSLESLGADSSVSTSGIVSIVLFVVVGLGLAFWELRVAKMPIFDFRILAFTNVALSYSITFLQVFSQVGLMFSVPLYLQVSQDASPGRSGLHLLPATVCSSVGSLFAGIFIGRYSKFRGLLIGSGSLSCVTFSLLLLRWNGNPNMSVWETLYIIPGGFATGIALSSAFVSALSFLEKSKTAAGTGLFFFSSSLGTICAMTATTAIVQRPFRSILERTLQGSGSQDIIERVTKDFSQIPALTGETRFVVLAAFVHCLRFIYISGFMASFISSTLALLLRNS